MSQISHLSGVVGGVAEKINEFLDKCDKSYCLRGIEYFEKILLIAKER